VVTLSLLWCFIREFPLPKHISLSFNQYTRFLAGRWQKSFTNALAGLLVKEGRLNISAPAGFKEWQGDERSKITLNDLLHMQSGLKWNEDYGNRSDVNLMLHNTGDMAEYAIHNLLNFSRHSLVLFFWNSKYRQLSY